MNKTIVISIVNSDEGEEMSAMKNSGSEVLEERISCYIIR